MPSSQPQKWESLGEPEVSKPASTTSASNDLLQMNPAFPPSPAFPTSQAFPAPQGFGLGQTSNGFGVAPQAGPWTTSAELSGTGNLLVPLKISLLCYPTVRMMFMCEYW